MSFKTYYHNKLNEEGNFLLDPLDDEAPVERKPEPKAETNGISHAVGSYISADPKLKVALTKLGSDLGKAIADYAKNQLVTRENFDSDDDYQQYCNIIRDGVEEKYNVTLIELLKNIGIFIDNKVNERAN